jgi:two-component system nitrate/nitrite sensor histidine kinase NarX
MEERATIARELHDSIAQSLSCMKMQVSCLQMQGDDLPEESRQLLGQIRNELNTSWAQLRELLTTFRLQLTEPGLRPALEASCQENTAPTSALRCSLITSCRRALSRRIRPFTCCKSPAKR